MPDTSNSGMPAARGNCLQSNPSDLHEGQPMTHGNPLTPEIRPHFRRRKNEDLNGTSRAPNNRRRKGTMALTILDDIISSDRTAHSARVLPGASRGWEVSWLAGRRLDRNAAITAMVLADATGPGGMHPGYRLWIHVEGWAAELGLTAPGVLARTARAPSRAEARNSAMPADPEAAG
jgi:hypothetical protein